MYTCGHTFHRSCLDKIDSCPKCVIATTKAQKKKKQRGKRPQKVHEEEENLPDADRGRGQTMAERAESASLDDEQAKLIEVVSRYRSYARLHQEASRFQMLQVLEQGSTDIYAHVSALQLAPDITIERKIRPRQRGALPTRGKYKHELTSGESKRLFPSKNKRKTKPATKQRKK